MTPLLPTRLRRTVGYARAWAGTPSTSNESEATFDRGDRRLPASVFSPPGDGPPRHAWVVLHGITRPGRAHPTLLRFARAVAASGAVVVVPEVPEWIELSLAPEQTLPTTLGSIELIERELGVPAERTGVMGFSFGAPQGLLAASDPRLVDRVAGVASFGGYCDLRRTNRYLFTGLHEWQGVTRRRRPDPYGRWIVAANFILHVDGYSGADSVRAALLALAQEAGEQQIPAWDPIFDPLKARIRATLTREEAELFDEFAPDSTVVFDARRDEAGERWAAALAEAGRRVSPLVDPTARLGRTPANVQLLHGRGDDLIPYTETLRWSEAVTAARQAHGMRSPRTTITGLFAHAGEEKGMHPLRTATETARFARALSRVLAIP